MFTNTIKLIPAALFVLGCHVPVAFAQKAPGVAERQHAIALASFREARFPDAYGRFIALADAGHVPSAELALWMYTHGLSVFGKDWDSSQEQLTAWAKLTGQVAPTMVAMSYPKAVAPVANRTREGHPLK